MSGIMKKIAAMVLAVAMIAAFTPLYGMDLVAYAENEEIAAEQDASGADDAATGDELSGEETGEDPQLAPEENPVTEDPDIENRGGTEEDSEEALEEAGDEEAPVLRNLEDGDGEEGGDDGDDPFAGVYQANLERTDADYNWFFTDGTATFQLTDQDALNVEGVVKYVPYVSTGPDGGWAPIDDSCWSYDDSTKTIVLNGPAIAAKPEYDDIWKIFVQIKGVGENAGPDNEDIKMIATSEIKFWATYSRYDLPGDHDVLPGWDGEFRESYGGYIEDTEHPYGEDFSFQVTNVEVIDGRDLIEWSEGSEGGHSWWYYEAKEEYGTVTFRITYKDYYGEVRTEERHVFIGGDVYESNMWSEGNVDIGLPGSQIILHASGGHKYMAGETDERHEAYTEEGIDFIWEIERGEEYGEITPDANDPSTATLTLKEVPGDDYEDVGCRVKLTVVDTNSDDPTAERSVQDKWFRVSTGYHIIWPNELNQGLNVGQTISNQKFEIRYYKYGGTAEEGYNSEHYKNETINNAKWEIEGDEDAFEITTEDGEKVVYGEEYNNCDTFSIKRLGDRSTLLRLILNETEMAKFVVEYPFFNKDYDLRFDRDEVDIFEDISAEAFAEEASFRIDTGSFGNGAEADEAFDFDIKVGECDDDEWVKEFEKGTDYFVNRDGNELVVTFSKENLDFSSEKDIRIEACAKIKGTDEPCAQRTAWMHLKSVRYEFDPQSPMEMLPGDGYQSDGLNVYIENSEYPWGQQFYFPITGVTIESGGEYLDEEELVLEEDDFRFRAKERGRVVFLISYLDENDVEHTGDDAYRFVVDIVGETYEVWQHREGPSDTGLPGTSIELWADGVHRYLDENGQQREDWEGLDYDWDFAYGEDIATLKVDANDSSHATLTFNKLPEGEDWIDDDVCVVVGVKDKDGNIRDTQDRMYWVRSEYDEITPTELGQIDLGKGTGDITFKVNRYSLSDSGEAVVSEYAIDSMEWDFDPEIVSVTTADGEPYDGERVPEDTFSFFRNKRVDTNLEFKAYYTDEEGDCEYHGDFHLDDLYYNLWFDTGGEAIYDDSEWTIHLQKEDEMDYSGLNIEVKAGNYEWNDELEEDIFYPAPDDCWSLSDDGMSVTVYGDKMAENGIEELRVYAEAWYEGEMVGDRAECNFDLCESCTARGEEHLWLSAPPEYADCYSKGWQKQVCWNCGERRVVQVAARGHIGKAVNAKAATASKEGNVKYWKCADCGKCFGDAKCTKEVTVDSRIIPKGTAISKVKAQKKGFTVTWKKPTGTFLKHTTGYEVTYALDSKFKKSAKTVTISKNATVTKKVTKLKAKKKYYVKVRSYRLIDGKKQYSPWSAVKTIKTK